MVALLAFATTGLTQPVSPEARIKAAFLYKFGAFIQWPPAAFAGSDDAFVIGIVSSDELAGELEQMVRGRTILERRVEVRRLALGEDGLGRVQILFVGEAASAALADISAAVQGQPILIVTETESALTQGSMINFVREQNKVRFDVALAPAERGHLAISSRLLMVARKVITNHS